jgi:hypothetical protein
MGDGMDLFFDDRDDPYHEKVGSRILHLLDVLGRSPSLTPDPPGKGSCSPGPPLPPRFLPIPPVGSMG